MITALAAAEAGRWDDAANLVKTGADIDVGNKHGASLLWLAARHGQISVLKTLVQVGANVNKADDNGTTPLAVAATAAIAATLIEHGAGFGLSVLNYRERSALWLAVKNGREDVVQVLVEAGADVNQADDYGAAPLHVATSASVVASLIGAGARVDATNRSGQSALWLAAKNGCQPVVDALLQAGADVNLPDHERTAPLSVAR